MYIVIIGGGSVGYHLCKALLREGHEVLVLDKDPSKCERFEDELGSVCIRGDGCEVTTQSNAGVARADVFIATTNEDEDNLSSLSRKTAKLLTSNSKYQKYLQTNLEQIEN